MHWNVRQAQRGAFVLLQGSRIIPLQHVAILRNKIPSLLLTTIPGPSLLCLQRDILPYIHFR